MRSKRISSKVSNSMISTDANGISDDDPINLHGGKDSNIGRRRQIVKVETEFPETTPTKQIRKRNNTKEEDDSFETALKKRAKISTTTKSKQTKKALAKDEDSEADSHSSPKERKVKIPKAAPSISAPSPFPDWPKPSPEEAEEVLRLLNDKHGKLSFSQKSRPSLYLQVEGCNEDIPAMIDVIIRVRLSAATNDLNASRAFIGLLNTFGRPPAGSGINSIVNWEAVRLAPLEDVYEAIRIGGMGAVKSKSIKAILDVLYAENLAALQIKKGSAKTDATETDLLSVEHYRLLSKDDLFTKCLALPGIGPKSASCIISFGNEHGTFAVDTHVFRICTSLGWAPPKIDRNQMFFHLEARLPEHCKFELHFQFIIHGRSCARCRGNASSSSKGWDEADCPLEHLVKRKKIQKGD